MVVNEIHRKLNVLPDIGDIIFLCIVRLTLLAMPGFLLRDGSTGWHLVAGHYIFSHWSLPAHDLISYTFSNQVWIDYEWLSDLIMGFIESLAGLNGIALFSTLMIAYLFLSLYERCRDTGCNFLLATALTACGALAASVHFLARPHLFTFWGVYIFSTRLESFYRGKISFKSLVVQLMLCMLIWVNTHPAFIIGFFIVAIYFLSSIVERFFNIQKQILAKRQLLQLSVLTFLLFAISLINPWGWKLYLHIANYLSFRQVLTATSEYMAPIFNGTIQPTTLLVLFFLLVTGIVFRKNRPSLPQLILVLAFSFMALSSVRHIPLFVVVGLPFIAECYAQMRPILGGRAEENNIAKIKKKWLELNEKFDRIEFGSRMHIVPICLSVILSVAALNGGTLCSSTLCGRQILKSDFDPKYLPVKSVDYLGLSGLANLPGFNLDNWGGYIRYKLGVPVFIDDRADFYGQKFFLQYSKVNFVNPGWMDVLDKNHIQWVLVPKSSRLAARLEESSCWKEVCADQIGELFVRNR